MNNKAIEEGRKELEALTDALVIMNEIKGKVVSGPDAVWKFVLSADKKLQERHRQAFDKYFREQTYPETCEDRNYKCCETLTEAQHMATYGYDQFGNETLSAEILEEVGK